MSATALVQEPIARLDASAVLSGLVFEGEVPLLNGKPRNRYVRVFVAGPTYDAERLDNRQTNPRVTYIVHCVGVTPADARELRDEVDAQWLNHRPSVAGWNCWPMSKETSSPVQDDDDTVPTLWFTVDSYELTATPATTS